MRSRFPGMNPYLESPSLWSEVHSWIIVELARTLNVGLLPKYRAAVEKRVYEESILIGILDVLIKRYLEVRDVASGEVVTVVEVLSPSNKRSGEGRDQYLVKRKKLLSSAVHLVEIDLLRGGEPMPMRSPVTSDYRVLVSRLEQRSIAELYAFNLRNQLPCFLLPLRNDDPEPIVDLNIVMDVVVQSAGLEFAIDYDQAIVPTLKADDLAWVTQLIAGC
jgi:hypothetical protein